MTELWCPGAEKIRGPHSGGSGPMTGGPPRIIWHRTAGGTYASNKSYLKAEGFEPHLLWDPTTGELGQFMPANVGGFAVQHTEVLQTNRMGTICLQIEVADHGETWNITDTKMLGIEKIIAFIRQLGIPDELPAGPMAPLGKSGKRDPKVWASKGGHYGHCHVPENSHTDPGRMDFKKVFGAAPKPPKPVTAKPYSKVNTALIQRATTVLAKRATTHVPLDAGALTLTNELIKAAEAAEAVR